MTDEVENEDPYSPAVMRKKFCELTAQREAIEAESKPARDAYEALRKQEQEIGLQQLEFAAIFKKIEAPLGAIEKRRAAIARALRGQTGEPKDKTDEAA